MFLQLCVILFTGGGVCQGDPPRRRPPCQGDPPRGTPQKEAPPNKETPQKEAPPPKRPPRRAPQEVGPQEGDPQKEVPPKKETPPRRRHPSRRSPCQGGDPPKKEAPPRRHPPPKEADSGIRSMSGRYASYWNAFLFVISSVVPQWWFLGAPQIIVSPSACDCKKFQILFDHPHHFMVSPPLNLHS